MNGNYVGLGEDIKNERRLPNLDKPEPNCSQSAVNSMQSG